MSRPWFGRRDAGRRDTDGRDTDGRDTGSTATGADGWGTFTEAMAPAITIDALGRKCPIPVIMLAERVRDAPVGAIIALLADDPAAFSDIPAWCSLKSHDCVFRAELPSGWAFGIRRRY